jgi:hypothetical protein
LSENPGSQYHIKGLIAVCKGDNEKALTAFNLAASLEPDQVFTDWLCHRYIKM